MQISNWRTECSLYCHGSKKRFTTEDSKWTKHYSTEERNRRLRNYQASWDEEPRRRWTAKLISDDRRWTEKKQGEGGYLTFRRSWVFPYLTTQDV